MKQRSVVGTESASSSPGAVRPVLFVGLDGADWQLLDRYAAAGLMPHLARIASEGRTGVLKTLHPPLSPLVWTTMMTGAGPLEHGILDFTRFEPISGAREPITSAERRLPAIWNMATSAGKSVGVFGMWATWPAEAVRGVIVSDRLFSFQFGQQRPPPAVVFPPGREGWALSALARAEEETGFSALQAYLPWLSEPEYARLAARPDPYADPASALRRILIETRVYHALARAWVEEARPDLTILYIQGTDAIGHVFAPFAPPRREGVSPEEFARYAPVSELYFRSIDALLGEHMRLAREQGAVLMLASDHGFSWSEARPLRRSSMAAATAGQWHRDDGIYALWGGGIAPAPRDSPARSVFDVCPTLLALLGLPQAPGMTGTPLPGVPVAAGYSRARAPSAVAASKEAPSLAAPPAAAPNVAAVSAMDGAAVAPSAVDAPSSTPAAHRTFPGTEPSSAASSSAGSSADPARPEPGSARPPAGEAGGAARAAAGTDSEEIAKLRSLGYIGAGEALRAPARAASGGRSQQDPRASGDTGRDQPGSGGHTVRDQPGGGQSDPTRTAASWNNEGLILNEQRRGVEAAAAFERALDLDPGYASALWNLSELLCAEARDGEGSRAEADPRGGPRADRGRAAAPSDPSADGGTGARADERPTTPSATRADRGTGARADERAADRSDALILRALSAGLTDGAEHVIGRAIAWQRSGRGQRSLRLLDQAVALRPGEPGLWLFRGRYRMERRECAAARSDFERATRLDGTSAPAWAAAGLASMCLGDGEGAEDAFRRSLALDPDQPELRRALDGAH